MKTMDELKEQYTYVIEPLRFTSKIWKQGSSLIVTIPKGTVKLYSLKKHDRIEVVGRILSNREIELSDNPNIVLFKKPFIDKEIYEELKQSFIDDIKELRITDRKFHKEKKLNSVARAYNIGKREGIIEYIKKKFNITNDDLK